MVKPKHSAIKYSSSNLNDAKRIIKFAKIISKLLGMFKDTPIKEIQQEIIKEEIKETPNNSVVQIIEKKKRGRKPKTINKNNSPDMVMELEEFEKEDEILQPQPQQQEITNYNYYDEKAKIDYTGINQLMK